jgi:hypothetical protein
MGTTAEFFDAWLRSQNRIWKVERKPQYDCDRAKEASINKGSNILGIDIYCLCEE